MLSLSREVRPPPFHIAHWTAQHPVGKDDILAWPGASRAPALPGGTLALLGGKCHGPTWQCQVPIRWEGPWHSQVGPWHYPGWTLVLTGGTLALSVVALSLQLESKSKFKIMPLNYYILEKAHLYVLICVVMEKMPLSIRILQ